ncbi:hypothetical protein CK203_023775 [Vitis vinifera]|uniref:Uncharacterized protein n=1 Tax=Vitis vinifera TaxID=29760 RepID=A0A438JA21_VITVI|nr:hypothetical protein CK203_023775 [Vitis vinifera]
MGQILVKWGGEARPNVLEIEGEEESYVVTLWWECWPVLRRKCRDEADRHSREVRGEEDSRAGQRSDEGLGEREARDAAPVRRWDGAAGGRVGSGREQSRLKPDNLGGCKRCFGPDAGPSEVVGCYPKGPASSLVQLTNKGLLCSKACTQQLGQDGTIREGPNSLAVQEVTGLILKWSAPSYPPEAEFFVARENEDTRKLQGGVRLTETDRALKEESMRLAMKGSRNVRNWETSTATVTKVREMEGVGDIDDAQVVRSELEGNWEESGLASSASFWASLRRDWRRKS